MYRRLRYAVVAAGVIAPLLGPSGHGAERRRESPACSSLARAARRIDSPYAEPLKLPRFSARAHRLERTRRLGSG